MPPLTIHQAFELAVRYQRAGRLEEAEQLYRQIITEMPEHADAIHFLGVLNHLTGRGETAVDLIQRAIALRPSYAEAYYNLGISLRGLGRLDEAIIAYRQSIALCPTFAEAYSNLGIALGEKGRVDEAIAACLQAIAVRPDFAQAHINLGTAFKLRGRINEALTAFRQAIALDPTNPRGHSNLGTALKSSGLTDEAVAAHQQAIAIAPNFSDAYNNLGMSLMDKGRLDEAIGAFRHAVLLAPNFVEAYSNLIYALHFHSDSEARTIADELRRWALLYAEPLRTPASPASASTNSLQRHLNDKDPDRRLRIGYVSPDFRKHPVGRFLAPLVDHHDHTGFEVFCYSDVVYDDSVTDHIRNQADVWRKVVGMTDVALAMRIREDKIDILVDLTMHMDRNRLLTFARKPAQVQVTYLAYCSTTGLDAIDYRLTDPYLDPMGENDQFYTEKSIRLPNTYWCYEPGIEAPEVGPLPALAAGYVTFGCLNNFAKVSSEALATWIQILKGLPASRLLLHAHQGDHRQRTLDRFQREGIDPSRLTFVDFLKGHDYIRQYNQIDVALDPFPYAGGTTTCDGMWMGVPIITLAGRTGVGRGGVTLLNNVGLPELVARTTDEYVLKAMELAGDLPRLAQMRAGLRERMLKSPLMDAPKFARSVEAAYRQMWRAWCERLPEEE